MSNKVLFFLSTIWAMNCLGGNCVITYHIKDFPSFKTIEFFGEGSGVTYFAAKDSSKKEGTFNISDLKEPRRIMVATSHTDFSKIKQFWIYDGTVDITIDSTGNVYCAHSPLNDAYLGFRKTWDSISITFNPILSKYYNDTSLTVLQKDSLYQLITSYETYYADLQYRYSIEHPTSFLALDFLSFYLPTRKYPIAKLDTLFDRIDASLFRFPIYQNIKEAIQLQHSRYNVGDTIDFLPLTDKNGRVIDFKNLLKGKYIYINNWSSGCSACYPNNKKLRMAYKKLKSRMTIIGISDDTNKDSWLRAIKEDKLNWQNFCDLRGLLSIPDILLNCEFTPNGTLISPKGVIVKKNIPPIKNKQQFISEMKSLMP